MICVGRYEDAVVDGVFNGYDSDGSGTIEYAEYVRYLLRDSLARSSSTVIH